MVDTAAENPLLQQKLPVPAFASITNQQGVQNQADVVMSQTGAKQETEAANIASAELGRAHATLQQKRQDLQAAQADRVSAEADAAAAQRELTQAQANLSSANGQLAAAQAKAAQAQKDAEEAARKAAQEEAARKVVQPQASYVAPAPTAGPSMPTKDWANDPEFKELTIYAATDYNPRMWKAEEEALREINRQMLARGNRVGDSSGVDVAKIRRDMGQRYNVTIDGSDYADSRMRRYTELQGQAGNTYIPVDQSGVLAAHSVWKAKTGGDWRDWWDPSKRPPSAGVGKF